MNIEENITRKINLIDNDGLSAYSNHAAQQSHNAFRVFYNFIKETKESNFSDEEINKFLESNEWIELEKAMNELEEALYE